MSNAMILEGFFFQQGFYGFERIECTEKYAVMHIFLCTLEGYEYMTYFKLFSLRKGPHFLSTPLM